MAQKAANYGADIMRMAEKSLLLQILDQSWKEHLLQLEHLRQGINLRAYAQRDPLNEYKREAFEMFEAMLGNLREAVTSVLSHVELRVQRGGEEAPPPEPAREPAMLGGNGPAPRPAGRSPSEGAGPRLAAVGAAAASADFDPRTPRNAQCPCGSGKKFKHCHGRI
jgi:preprotein translocase subunit SecA